MNDKQDQNDRILDGLVRRTIVPKGFRPETDAEIEAMLDGLGQGEMPDDKLQRMLGKINGQIPMSWERDDEVSPYRDCDTAEARELAEMFRAKGEELPPELQEKLREMEERAAEYPDEEEDTDGK